MKIIRVLKCDADGDSIEGVQKQLKTAEDYVDMTRQFLDGARAMAFRLGNKELSNKIAIQLKTAENLSRTISKIK
jgi:hypothetical protein